MRKIYLVLSMFLLMVIPAKSDSELPPTPYVSTSVLGRYYFKMIPDPAAPFDLQKGWGYAYRVTGQKADELMWSTSGWYSFQTYLSADGQYLVRIGNWPRGHEPSESHVAVVFYKEGKKIKSYSTRQIIRDKSKVEPSISHYQFLKEKPQFPDEWGYLFRLVSVDNIEYIFDIRTGTIATEKQLSGEK